MDNFADVVERLGHRHDSDSSVGRKKAFDACLAYANEHLNKSIDYNYFMHLASERFACEHIVKNILRLVPADGTEKVVLRYGKSGPCLEANKKGMIYLSKAMATLADSRLPGDHFHLRHGEFPMVGRSYPITVYLNDEVWFDEFCKEAEESADQVEETIPQRDIDPLKVRALIITDRIPNQMLLSSGTLYVIDRVEKQGDQKTWGKSIRDSKERMYVFELVNDDGVRTHLSLDLDDAGVVFLTDEQLRQLRRHG